MFDVKPITTLHPTDCGATCVKMLLDYYGIEVDLDTLVEECNTGVGGAKMRDMGNCARQHGIDSKYFKMDGDEVVTQDRPSIVWWKYGHFVVCCGMDDAGKVVICNPDRGRYPISLSLFNALYSGVVMFNGEPHDIETE